MKKIILLGFLYLPISVSYTHLSQFNTEIRGFYNYYSIANNASALGRSFGCIMKFSMYKTLAQKLNMSCLLYTSRCV